MGDLKKIISHKSFYNWILTQLKLILILEDYDLFNINFSSQYSTFILSFVFHCYIFYIYGRRVDYDFESKVFFVWKFDRII